jgi:hypothetical protein
MIEKRQHSSPALSASFRSDVEKAIFSLNRAFDPLSKDCLLDFHVSGVRNGYVYLSFALPEGMTNAFVSLLQSLHGFFRFADHKARIASIEHKVVDPSEVQARRDHQEAFRSKVCGSFDEFRDQGLDAKEAIKRTNSALKEAGHPWASYAVVSEVLRAAGRLRKRRGKQAQ